MAEQTNTTGYVRRLNNGQLIQIDRDGDDLRVGYYGERSASGEYTLAASFTISLREFCEELGILPGDVPADMGYRGY